MELDKSIGEPERALVELLQRLDALGYGFVTPTPATHARVLARREGGARTLRDVFGWSLPFGRDTIRADLLDLLERGGALAAEAGRWRSAIRVSRVAGLLFAHGV